MNLWHRTSNWGIQLCLQFSFYFHSEFLEDSSCYFLRQEWVLINKLTQINGYHCLNKGAAPSAPNVRPFTPRQCSSVLTYFHLWMIISALYEESVPRTKSTHDGVVISIGCAITQCAYFATLWLSSKVSKRNVSQSGRPSSLIGRQKPTNRSVNRSYSTLCIIRVSSTCILTQYGVLNLFKWLTSSLNWNSPSLNIFWLEISWRIEDKEGKTEPRFAVSIS